jgi:hypothetical protein
VFTDAPYGDDAFPHGLGMTDTLMIQYPQEGSWQFDMYLMGLDPDVEYSFGWSESPGGAFSGLTVNAVAPGVPVVTGTIDCTTEQEQNDFAGSEMTFTLSVPGDPDPVQILQIDLKSYPQF